MLKPANIFFDKVVPKFKLMTTSKIKKNAQLENFEVLAKSLGLTTKAKGI